MNQPPRIFAPDLIAAHLRRRTDPENFVTNLVITELKDRLGTFMRDFPRAAIIGPDPQRLPQTARTASAEIHLERYPAFIGTGDMPILAGEQYNLIVSVLHLQTINDIPSYLAQLRARLLPDGLLVVATLGGETLTELREAFLAADTAIYGGAMPRVAPMIQLRDGGTLLQRADLALPVADIETHIVRYSSALALMLDLKAMGASNPLADRPRRLATPALLTAAAETYTARASDPDGKVRATLEIIWLSGWAPHESQQKPLRPGSATTHLSDVLTSQT